MRALGIPEARADWDHLLELYVEERDCRVTEGLAVAIAAIADDTVITQVIDLLRDRGNGPSRALLLSALEGSTDQLLTSVMDELGHDPELAESVHALQRSSRRRHHQRALPTDTGDLIAVSTNYDMDLVEPFLEELASIVTGLERREIHAVTELIRTADLDSTREMELVVGHEGRRVPLRIRVFMDDSKRRI